MQFPVQFHLPQASRESGEHRIDQAVQLHARQLPTDLPSLELTLAKDSHTHQPEESITSFSLIILAKIVLQKNPQSEFLRNRFTRLL